MDVCHDVLNNENKRSLKLVDMLEKSALGISSSPGLVFFLWFSACVNSVNVNGWSVSGSGVSICVLMLDARLSFFESISARTLAGRLVDSERLTKCSISRSASWAGLGCRGVAGRRFSIVLSFFHIWEVEVWLFMSVQNFNQQSCFACLPVCFTAVCASLSKARFSVVG